MIMLVLTGIMFIISSYQLIKYIIEWGKCDV